MVDSWNIYQLAPGATGVSADRSLLTARVASDGEGRGHLDVFSPQADKLRPLFEQPIEIRGPGGELQRVLKPWSREALEHLTGGGLFSQGFATEKNA